MTTPTSTRLGRNDPCYCGSGKKYKNCHLDADNAAVSARREADRAAAEAEDDGRPPIHWDYYRPLTHKIPAIKRPDFLVAVRNLAATGDGARLRISEPQDLGRDQASVDAAIAFLRENHVEPEFWLDPPPPIVAATQDLLDRVLGRGVCRVVPSGFRLRRYGQTELVPDAEGGYIAYVAGRKTMAGVIGALYRAVRQDALALGIDNGIMAEVWCSARVTREIVVNLLALPKELADRSSDLVNALIDLLSRDVDLFEARAPDSNTVRVLVALPYLVGLREARREPRRGLEGMGLTGSALDALAVQLETAAEGPPWLLRLADLAGDDWDAPDGYHRWLEAAESIDEIAPWLKTTEPAPEETIGESLASPPTVAREAMLPATTAEPGLRDIAAVPPQPMASEPSSAFAAVDALVGEHAIRRREIEDRLKDVIDRRGAVARMRRELHAQLEALARDDAAAADEEARVTDELSAFAVEEATARQRAVIDSLAVGRAALDASAAAWSAALGSRSDRDQASLAAAERTIADFDAMERKGLLAQLPDAVRARLRADADVARRALHDMLGGRDPIRVPVVVVANADPALTLQVGLPFAGRSELSPASLQTSLAIAIAGVLAETVQALKETPLEEVEHETLPNRVSIVRLRFAAPPPVPAEDCAQFCASSLSDLGHKSASLREAGVSVEARVEPDLESEEDS